MEPMTEVGDVVAAAASRGIQMEANLDDYFNPKLRLSLKHRFKLQMNNNKEKMVEKNDKAEGKKVERRERKQKQGITIPLTKREIEEDIYALTGSLPNKRPKKHAKNVQKNLNDTFPGLDLSSITRERYRLSEP